jgi:thiamine transport system substrate-binding protein
MPVSAQERSLTLMSHDSFFLPPELIEAFEAEHGVDVRLLPSGDAGAMVNQAILTADRPLADVLFGVDNTFLSRALEADIFEPYRSPALVDVPDAFELDPEARVTPVDYGDVCINLDRSAFGPDGLTAPASLADLTQDELRGTLVVQNPATSSPGLAFLLSTIATFGDDPETGWQAFWADLRDNDVQVASGWEEAYWGAFSGAGDGDRPVVVSYGSSPAVEMLFADPVPEEAPTTAIADGCFRQIEFAGVLRGTAEPELAGRLIDHLLSPEVQAAIPEAMLVYPVREGVELPPVFTDHAVVPDAPVTLDPAVIDANREAWISQWTDIVLR